MIDHLSIDVSDLKKSGHFYDNALKPLGYTTPMDSPREFGGRLYLGWGDSADTDLYINEGSRIEPPLHIAFKADSRERVDGAFVLDPDGHNIEAVCHAPQKG